MFFGKFYHNLDDKGRLMIPSKMREQAGSRVYVIRGFEGCLSVYKEADFQTYAASLSNLSFTHKQTRDVQRLGLSSTLELDVDKQGRIQIPSQTLVEYHFSKNVVIVGVMNHFEIWDEEAWKKYEDSNSKKYEEIAETLPL
ncbi:MAG: division/cell wall cluster transcriptional repressor MraZ [Bacilli bacterium]|jgi:MraZ protein